MFGRLDGEGQESIDIALDKLAQIALLARAFDAQTSKSDCDAASNAAEETERLYHIDGSAKH